MAASPLRSQELTGEPPGRPIPIEELDNPFELEPMAQSKLDSETYAEISGSNRKPFDRITFRPRVMVNTAKLDLTTELFGQNQFAPILIAPVSQQKRFHPDGELAMMRGASAAKTVMVIADRSDYPYEQIAAEAKTGFWYQVYPDADMNAVKDRVKKAVTAGCKAVCLTLGVPSQVQQAPDWKAIDRLREGLGIPLLLKGIMSPEEALAAVQRGVRGIVVSNYVGRSVDWLAAPIEVLPAVASAVGGKIPILIDGGFRRGSDLLKAIALGARAVLIGRPTLWGLAAYGSAGVQTVLELLQSELARDMAMCGRLNIKAVDQSVVKIHRW